MTIKVKRIYEPRSEGDGYRILIDRLWPRGMKKENAQIDQWLKEIAPSTALRKWYNHDPSKWDQFRREYHAELNRSAALHELLNCMRQHQTITLLFAAKEEKYNHAEALQQFLNDYA